MKNMKINYFVVGCFVLGMLVALVVSVATLTGRTGATDDYVAYYKNVTGLKFGTQVLYEGYPIGQVEEITPEASETGMRFRVDLTVQEGWRIPADSTAQIAAPGLLSALTIAISAGEASDALTPGSEITSREQADIFAAVSAVAGEISELANSSLKPLLVNINRSAAVLGSAMENDGEAIFNQIRGVADRAPAIADDIEIFAAKLKDSSTELAVLFSEENRKDLEGIINNVSGLSKDLTKTQRNLDTLMVSLKDVVTDNSPAVDKTISDLQFSADSLARHIESMNQNLEGASRNFYEFSRQIRSNPGLLLGGTPPAPAATR